MLRSAQSSVNVTSIIESILTSDYDKRLRPNYGSKIEQNFIMLNHSYQNNVNSFN
jgi:hypothetical protein